MDHQLEFTLKQCLLEASQLRNTGSIKLVVTDVDWLRGRQVVERLCTEGREPNRTLFLVFPCG
jgi:hypothetical protein